MYQYTIDGVSVFSFILDIELWLSSSVRLFSFFSLSLSLSLCLSSSFSLNRSIHIVLYRWFSVWLVCFLLPLFSVCFALSSIKNKHRKYILTDYLFYAKQTRQENKIKPLLEEYFCPLCTQPKVKVHIFAYVRIPNF